MSKREEERLCSLEEIRSDLFLTHLDPGKDQSKELAITDKICAFLLNVDKKFSRAHIDHKSSLINQREKIDLIHSIRSIRSEIESLSSRSFDRESLGQKQVFGTGVTQKRVIGKSVTAENLFWLEQQLRLFGWENTPPPQEIENAYRIYSDLVKKYMPYYRIKKVSFRNIEGGNIWKQARRLANTFIFLGLDSNEDRRMYVQGVTSARNFFNPVHKVAYLTVVSSPLSFWYYLKFLKHEWYEAYSPYQDDTGHKKHWYGNGYEEEKMLDAIIHCQNLINQADPAYDSRLMAEIPEALGDNDMMTFYCWGSGLVRKLYHVGAIKVTWPNVHNSLHQVFVKAKEDVGFKKMLRRIKKKSDKMWQESGIPETRPEDMNYIASRIDRRVVSRVVSCLSA